MEKISNVNRKLKNRGDHFYSELCWNHPRLGDLMEIKCFVLHRVTYLYSVTIVYCFEMRKHPMDEITLPSSVT